MITLGFLRPGTLCPRGFYVCCLLAKSFALFCDPMDWSPPGSSVHGISQQEYWNRLPFPPPGDLPDPGMESMSPALAGGSFTVEPPGKRGCILHRPPATQSSLLPACSTRSQALEPCFQLLDGSPFRCGHGTNSGMRILCCEVSQALHSHAELTGWGRPGPGMP